MTGAKFCDDVAVELVDICHDASSCFGYQRFTIQVGALRLIHTIKYVIDHVSIPCVRGEPSRRLCPLAVKPRPKGLPSVVSAGASRRLAVTSRYPRQVASKGNTRSVT